MFSFPGQACNDSIREAFPTFSLMRTRLMRSDGERRVQQEHPLSGPTSQASCRRYGTSQVIMDFFEYVLQRRREGCPVCHGEAQAFRLTRFMIGILSQQDHLHLFKGTKVEGIEDERARRIAGALLIFGTHKFCQFLKIGGIEFILQAIGPRCFYLYVHLVYLESTAKVTLFPVMKEMARGFSCRHTERVLQNGRIHLSVCPSQPSLYKCFWELRKSYESSVECPICRCLAGLCK